MGRLAWMVLIGMTMTTAGCGDACEDYCDVFAVGLRSCAADCGVLSPDGEVVFTCSAANYPGGACTQDEWVAECREEWQDQQDQNSESSNESHRGICQGEIDRINSASGCCESLGCGC